jgi:membrane-bound lytic murein transglycosylase F
MKGSLQREPFLFSVICLIFNVAMTAVRLKIFLGVLFLMSISCQESPKVGFYSEPEVQIDLEAIKKRGYLNALVDNNSTSYFIYKGVPMGYEFELLELFTKELGVGLKIKVTSGIERAIEQLNSGEGDILAFPMTVSKERKKYITFTKAQYNTYEVLVQRKPHNWRNLTERQVNDSLIRDLHDLLGKEIHVLGGTTHAMRLENLSEEIGTDFVIREDSVNTETESLIRRVATGEIDYTVANHMVAQVNAAYYDNIDVATVLSLPRQVSWGVRKNSTQLEAALNDWLTRIKKEATFMIIYNRYYKSPRTSLMRLQSDYSSLGGRQLSQYDDLIKEGAKTLGWDWRLLASMVYQESHFMPSEESWAGARGLMQLMPGTAKEFGASDLNDPRQSMKAGVAYLQFLNKYWSAKVPDPQERLKFILSSYNAGLSHIVDAYKLAEKYGKDPSRWEGHVQVLLLKKSDPKYYRDPLVTVGYCKCEEPVNYVREVLERYEQYRLHIDS